MKIKYLGTAAAEGVPAIFCQCENCRKSRELGGRNIRTRSQALIDDAILIDFPADTYMHYLTYNFPLDKIKTCIITHSHSDHLYPADLEMRTDVFSHIKDKEALTFYSAKSGYDMVMELVDRYNMQDDVNAVLIKPLVSFEAEGYAITPIPATHDAASSPVVFLIEKEGKSVLYSNDTSEYPEEGWEYLAKLNKSIGVVSMDCTEGENHTTYDGHLNIWRVIEMRKRMLELGIAYDKTVFILNHFSHNGGNVVYDDFIKTAKDNNFLVSYDGMEYEF